MLRVLIYGAGAIGSFVGYLLSELKEGDGGCTAENVVLLGRTGHVQSMRQGGLRIRFQEGERRIRFKHCITDISEIEKIDFAPDIVVVCVKTHSLALVLEEITDSGLLNGKLKDATFILLMNGMGNREIFDLPSNQVFEGITSIGVVFSENGVVEIRGKGKTIMESAVPRDLREFTKEMFLEKGFELGFADDFKVHQWNKLFANAVINPITALIRENNGVVLSGHLESTVKSIVEECVKVAEKEGLTFNSYDVQSFVYSVAVKTSANTSSMLQDILKGKKTEIDSINGYIVRLAKKHSLDAPANETLYSLIKAAESTKFPQAPAKR